MNFKNTFFLKTTKLITCTALVSIPLTSFAVNQDNGLNAIIAEPRPIETKSEYKPHLGALTGIDTPEGNYQSSAEYGMTIGYQPYIPFSIGAEFSHSKNNVSSGDSAADLDRTKLLMNVAYNFGGHIPVISKSYVALAVGPMLESTNSSDSVVIGTMPNAGFDMPFNIKDNSVSLGLNARYLISSSGASNTFSLNAMAKYWF